MKKACSLLLAFVMILSMFPSYALAEKPNEQNPPEIVIEDPAGESAQEPTGEPAEEPEQEPVELMPLDLPDPQDTPTWDLLDAETVNGANLNSDVLAGKKSGGEITPKDGYVHIKNDSTSVYTWLMTKDGFKLPSEQFTVEATIRLAEPLEKNRSNEFSARIAGKDTGRLYPIFLKYGVDGGVATKDDYSDLVPVDTTIWHNYGIVVNHTDKSYNVYVDGDKVTDTPIVSNWKYDKADLIRVGADTPGCCNMDVQSIRAGTGDLSSELGQYPLPEDTESRLTAADLSASGQKQDEAKTITATVTSENFEDNTPVTVKLVDKDGQTVQNVTADGSFTYNTAVIELTIPANLAVGTYYVEAQAGDSTVRSAAYTVETALEAPTFPTFAATGYTIDMADYKYNPTEEFNFPTIVDTQAHPVNNAFGNNAYRYYLFYAPHDAPAGNCVAASNSLDGPWVEYDKNPVVAKTWPKEDGSGNHYSVTHVSSPHVMWLKDKNCYIMYYHGENNTTRYALSDDLINWEYGGVCVTADQFSTDPTSINFNEASYARVFEHEVPGLGNKYIMLLMITGSGTGGQRNIYWAHSKDGIVWTPVQKSLLDPSMNHVYQGNFSGPFFMPWVVDGVTRYFVLCHASSGEMYAFEVGEKLDQCIEWGEVYNSQGDRNKDDSNPNCYPDYGRSGAPCFIQDDPEDGGRWHMFYEAGKRLNTNIVHAVEVREGEGNELARAGLELENTTLMVEGTAQPTLHIFNKSNETIAADAAGLGRTYHVGDPTVIKYVNGTITALKEGESTAWVTVTLDGKTVASSKVAVTVAAPAEEIILTNANTPGKTALNLELPAIFKAQGVLEDPIDNYYLYFSYNDDPGKNRSIALATAPKPEGPWTAYNDGAPVMTKASLSVTGEVNAPWPVWDAENSRMLMYYSVGTNTIGVAESADGVTFKNIKTVLTANDLPQSTNAYQQSVYEYTLPGKDNKYLMLITGNGHVETGVTKDGKRIFYAWSKDGLSWTAAQEPLLSPDTGDKGNVASPRLLIKDGAPHLVYHNSNGNIGYSKLSPDFSSFERKGIYYNSVDNGEPDRGRAADAAFLEADGVLYMYYTARSNKANKAADASVLVCRRMGDTRKVLFQDDFNDGNADGWETTGGSWAVADGVYFQSSKSGSGLAFAGDMSWTDYEVEVKATPIETSKNINVMLSGRANGADTRYTLTYNVENGNGKLFLERKIGNARTKLASTAYTMEAGKTYTMRLVFNGENLTAYINGVKELEAVDSSISAGKIGLLTNNTSTKFDDVVVRALSDQSEPEPAGPIAVTDFGDHQVIQRDPETKNASVSVSGTAGTAAAKVEARVVKFDGGETVNDWTLVAENVAEGAAWAGSLTVPQGGWYKLKVRSLDENGEVLGEAQGTHKWGVGINILCIGQSNMVGQAPETPRTQADDLVANYTRSGNWTHLTDPYDGAGGSMTPALGNALVAKLGIPVGFIPAADSGSGLHAPNPFTTPPHGPTRYWMYYNESNPGDTSTIYGKAVTRALAAGGVELAVWNQGETDGAIMTAESVYESEMKTLLSRLRTDLGNENLPMFLCQIGTHNPNIANDTAYTAIRSAQHDLDDGKNFFLAATEMEFARKDTAHYRKDGMDEIGKRVANSILYYYDESGYYRGPYISGAEYADETRAVIDVRITHRGGTDITPAEGNIPGFSVLDGLNEVKVLSAVKKDATTIRLTLETPIASGSGQVRYLYGLNPFPDPKQDPSSTTSDLQSNAIVVKDNTPLALPLENTTEPILVSGDQPVSEDWDVMNHDMYPDWTADGWRTNTKTGTFTQKDDGLNILKPNGSALGSEKLYHYAISPANLSLPREGFTLRVTARVNSLVENQSNEIGVRMGLKSDDPNGLLASIFLGHGKNGYVSTTAGGTGRYVMEVDTTVWREYTMVVRIEGGAYVYDLYVDKTLAFENVPLVTYKGGDLVRLGADNGGRCDMDVQSVRVGSGEVLPQDVSPARVTSVALSADSQRETETRAVTVTVTGSGFEDGDAVDLTLVDRSYKEVPGVTARAVFAENSAAGVLTIPAGLPVNTYYVRAQANGRVRYSGSYIMEADRPAPTFPEFTPRAYTIDLDDYIYHPTKKEFNFPTIVDTRDHPVAPVDGQTYRYFLFYAPHDAPGGNYVAMSNSLDGPWTECSKNPVVSNVWPKEDGSGNYYDVSHVSSPFVMWNDVYDCYFMYFHGENPVTRYATSTDLVNWTYGGECVRATQFRVDGGEASYARVFEHEVPGLGNKYIMLLMISPTGGFGDKNRDICWAYSSDGKDWTVVEEPLLDPTMDEEYQGNFSGPFFMPREVDGVLRYFVICHASSGNMYAFEVGERLNECIPWGVFYDSKDSPDPNDAEHEDAWPDYGRAGAPCFIQDDGGVWHMFYEGGKRLHANIVHATAPADSVYVPPASNTVTRTETLPDGTKVTTKTNKSTGTVTVTALAPDGTKTVAVTKKDGSGTETLTRPDGVRADSKLDKDGGVTSSVTLPVSAGRTAVELPAGKGNTVILVNADGSERVLTLFTVEDGRATVLLDASARLRIERRDVGFADAEGAVAEAAAALAARGVFLGTGADTFSPALSVDRATIVTLLHRIDGGKAAQSAPGFNDVPENAWYAAGAAWAGGTGVTLGVGGGSFAPGAVLTWEQAAVMLHRYAVLIGAADTTEGNETEAALAWCAAHGVGAEAKSGEPVSRGALALMLYNYIEALVGR